MLSQGINLCLAGTENVMEPWTVAAFYQFAPVADPAAVRDRLQQVCEGAGTMGTILVAPEGVNGTIAGSREGIDRVLGHLRTLPGCAGLEHKESIAAKAPFYRMKVRLKREIVTMGVPGVDPNRAVGTYVAPEDWNSLIAAPDVVVIDTRNNYEVAIGTFDGAIDPHTTSFRAFPDWFRAFQETNKAPRIAMFCTGGIRCEKATAFLKSEGVEDVFHLKGGILKYLETVPEEESLWRGQCFVFDERVSVGHGLTPGPYDLCRACRMPVSAQDKASPFYVKGVSCPYCHEGRSEDQKERYRERQRQVEHAKTRGAIHIGSVPHEGAQSSSGPGSRLGREGPSDP